MRTSKGACEIISLSVTENIEIKSHDRNLNTTEITSPLYLSLSIRGRACKMEDVSDGDTDVR